MRIPFDSSYEENTYVIETESATEMTRLMHQDSLCTSGMGELFPRQMNLKEVRQVLDLACGPGGWALEVARTYPTLHVTGIDISKKMINYAQAQAWVQGMKNVEFREMNVLEPLNIPDNVFDIINARFIVGFLPKDAWPVLIEECLRITQPGGVLRLTEAEMGFSNSAACERLNSLFAVALHSTRRGFSPLGQHLGITPMLGYFLRRAGYQDVQCKAHVIDYSANMQAHDAFYQNFLLAYKLLQPFLIKTGVCTPEEFAQLYQQAQEDMSTKTFCGIWFYLSTWGMKGSKTPSTSVLHMQSGRNSNQVPVESLGWKFPRLANFLAFPDILRRLTCK